MVEILQIWIVGTSDIDDGGVRIIEVGLLGLAPGDRGAVLVGEKAAGEVIKNDRKGSTIGRGQAL